MGLIKLVIALPRARGVSEQFFHDHWRHPHGTWGKRISTVRHYVQSHRMQSSFLDETQNRYDGICEVWYEGIHDATSIGSHPVYKKYLIPDEPKFIDMEHIVFTFMDEEILMAAPDPNEVEGSADFAWSAHAQPVTIKLIQLIEQNGDQPWDGEDDLSLGMAIGALRHVRLRPNPILHPTGQHAAITPLATTDPNEGNMIGVRELWWPTYSAFEEGVTANPDAFNELVGRPGRATTMLCSSEKMV